MLFYYYETRDLSYAAARVTIWIVKSEWNLNCESIVDYITYGGDSGLGSMELTYTW